MNLETPPAWDNSTEYPSMQSPGFEADLKFVTDGLEKLRKLNADLAKLTERKDRSTVENARLISTLVTIEETRDAVFEILYNVHTYVDLELAVDAKSEAHQKMYSRMTQLSADLDGLAQPSRVFLTTADEATFEAFIKTPSRAPSRFAWTQLREDAETLLSEKEETLISALSPSGATAWGDLYNALSGTVTCELKYDDGRTETMGLAKASALIKGGDEPTRKAAWHAVQKAWAQHEEAAAASLNALAGWRLEIARKRSFKKNVHFLDSSLRGSRIQRRTLDAMMGAVAKSAPAMREALKKMAKAHGKPKLDPWDLLHTPPLDKNARASTFGEAVKTIRAAFSAIDPSMGEFVQMMADKKWLEGRVLPNKKGGAFCAGFVKSRTPRIFQTFMGSTSDVTTLAHELGHAYHSWVMRDMPLIEQEYPMTLAETASIFCESVLSDYLLANAPTPQIKATAQYAEAERAAAFLLNIPARFEFEREFYERRAQGALSAKEFTELTDKVWSKWYGDSLSQNETRFWQTKLHFYISGVSFYNYPYTFGYLFALSIYARRKDYGAGFLEKYKAVLRDTGRMTAEELIKKHFDEDAGTEAFWRKAVDVAVAKAAAFEA